MSSIDTIFSDLKTDMGYGLQLFESTFLIDNKIEINPNVDCILSQIAVHGNNKINKQFKKPDLRSLVNYLKIYYPKQKMVSLIVSTHFSMLESDIYSIRLEDLIDIDKSILENRPSLYIPSEPV